MPMRNDNFPPIIFKVFVKNLILKVMVPNMAWLPLARDFYLDESRILVTFKFIILNESFKN